MSSYLIYDAARDTGSSTLDVRAAWHDARDHSGDVRSGGTGDRATNGEYAQAYGVGQEYGLHSSSGGGSKK